MEKLNLKNLDEKTKIEIAITSIMVIALVIILGNSIKTILRTKKAVKSPPLAPVALREIAKREMSISDKSEQIESLYREAEARRAEKDLPWGRDPFAMKISLQETSWGLSDLKLEGIMWDEKNPCAIINGEVVKKDDKLGKNTVVQIEKDGVIISDGTKRYILRLW